MGATALNALRGVGKLCSVVLKEFMKLAGVASKRGGRSPSLPFLYGNGW
jgi:hypothetical protein